MLSISWNTQGSPILRLWSLKYNTSIYIEIKSYRTEYNMSCWRFTGIWWPDLLGHLQETGFWHQEVYNNRPYPFSFLYKRNLNSNLVKMMLWDTSPPFPWSASFSINNSLLQQLVSRLIGLLCSEQNNLRLSNKFLVKPPRSLATCDQPALLGEF